MTAVPHGAVSASGRSTSTIMCSGSIPGTPITTSTATTAASTRAGMLARPGSISPTCRSGNSTTSTWTIRRRSFASAAARRTMPRSAHPRRRATTSVSPTPTGLSLRAVTDSSRALTPGIRIRSTPRARTAGWCAMMRAPDRRRQYNRRLLAARIRRGGTGIRRSSSHPMRTPDCIPHRSGSIAAMIAATAGGRSALT